MKDTFQLGEKRAFGAWVLNIYTAKGNTHSVKISKKTWDALKADGVPTEG